MKSTANVALIGDQRETFASRTSSNLRIKLDNSMTKGEFIYVLKELGDYRVLGSFLASRRKELQDKDCKMHSQQLML